MKSLPVASLALVLALSGCSSSPSIEEQTKLVEYEKCLQLSIDFYLLSLEKNSAVGSETMARIKESNTEGDSTLLSWHKEDCAKLLP